MPSYSAEFRQRAVTLYDGGRSAHSVAAEFGCAPKSVTAWARKAGVEIRPLEHLQNEGSLAQRADDLRARVARHETPRSIAITYRVEPATVYEWMKQLGIRPAIRPHRTSDERLRAFELISEGAKVAEAAAAVGVTEPTVTRWLSQESLSVNDLRNAGC